MVANNGACVIFYPEATVTRDPEKWPMVAKNGVARLALEAGVRIAMGSDAAAEGHGRNLVELRLMHELGMSAPDVLRAATSSAAELMGIADRVGSIEPGKRADLTLVAGDPYDFGAYPGNVRMVFKAGRRVRG